MEPRLLRRGNEDPPGQHHGDQSASMEPRLLRRGNDGRRRRHCDEHELQWSHAFSDVETFYDGLECALGWHRFNGATPSQTWKLKYIMSRVICIFFASMEPRLLRRGNRELERELAEIEEASMEPRLLRRGNRDPCTRPHCPKPRFNGATPSQTWKHERKAAMRLPETASMEPRLLRRGNPTARLTAAAVREGFNGATPSQTWKPPPWWIGSRASMMLQWSHAFSDVETGIRTADVTKLAECFNGATPSQTWKPASRKRIADQIAGFNGATPSQTWKRLVSRQVLRQWRRFNGATPSQTWKHEGGYVGAGGGNASMEPRLLRRGNTTSSVLLANALRRLQWSHAFSDVETCASPLILADSSGFNGATPSQTWKPAAGQRRRSICGASMEPRLLRRGNTRQTARLRNASGASMEPRLLRRGNGVIYNADKSWGQYASMEPRLLRRGNARLFDTAAGQRRSFNGATPSQTWKPPGRQSSATGYMASMEPRLLRRGNHYRLNGGYEHLDASMEPRLLRRGN